MARYVPLFARKRCILYKDWHVDKAVYFCGDGERFPSMDNGIPEQKIPYPL